METKPPLKLVDVEFDIYRLNRLVSPADVQGQWFLSSTEDELSLVCESQNREHLKNIAEKSELDWRAIKVVGPLDLNLTGIIAGLSKELAQAKIPVFIVSTFDTDYLLVKAGNLAEALVFLKKAGYVFV